MRRAVVSGVLFLSSLASVFSPGSVHGQGVRDDLWMTDGDVNAAVLSSTGDTLFLGGGFGYVGPATGNWVGLDEATGQAAGTRPRVNGKVLAMAPDGNGGWYLGGEFTGVGGVPRNRLAHVQSDGTVSSWDPNPAGNVSALAVSGSTVYVGGEFDAVGGQVRRFLAAVQAGTGQATAWNPHVDGSVLAIAVRGSVVYVGGMFGSIGDSTRTFLGAINAVTGIATPWAPEANSSVSSIVPSGSRVYVAGGFTQIGGQPRSFAAALDTTTGTATAWNPGSDGGVSALVVSGPTVYAGGNFENIGGEQRNALAALDTVSGSATAWDPNPDDEVEALAVSGSVVYVGGRFTHVGGQPRQGIAGLSSGTGEATSWSPVIPDLVEFLAASGGTVFASGRFTSVGGAIRQNLAALDVASGTALSWNPGANGDVNALAVRGSTVYLGGGFTVAGGAARNRLAAVETATGSVTDWNPNADNVVNALAVSGSLVFAGGYFTHVGGQTRNGAAAIDAVSGNLLVWNPNVLPPMVYAIAPGAGTIYLGGDFTTVGGNMRPRLAAVNAGTGQPTSWAPLPNDDVLALTLSGSTLYAGGRFTYLGGFTRFRIAAISTMTHETLPWNPNAYNDVRALAVSGGTVYAGGIFSTIGGQSRGNAAALDAGSGLATSWNPSLNAGVNALAVDGTTVYVAGAFTRSGLLPRQGITAVYAQPGIFPVPGYYATIQAAIDAAGDGDTVLVAAGTYTGTGNVNLGILGKDLVLAYDGMVAGPWNGWSPDNLTGRVNIDTEGSGTGLGVSGGAPEIRGLSFVNGSKDDRGAGAGVFVSSASPLFDRCLFAGNHVSHNGAGIYIIGTSEPSFVNCTIAGNRSGSSGGGIELQEGGTASFDRCVVWGNRAELGGEVWVDDEEGTVIFTCSVVDSTGVSGAGTITYEPTGGGNVFTNPRFCEPRSSWQAPTAEGTYTVASDSPALPANNPCGQPLGVHGQGCATATSVWTADGDATTWQDGGNWSGGVPGAGEDVLIVDLPVTAEVVFDEGIFAGLLPAGEAQSATIGAFTSAEPLRIASGTLEVDGASTLDTLVLEPEGTLGGTGTVTAAVLDWRGGLMRDTGTTHVTDAVTLTASAVKSIRGGRTLENEGAWTWPGTGVLRHGDGALGTRMDNLPGGTLTVAGARLMDHEPTWGTAAAFTNLGTAVQTADSVLTVEAVTTNAGTLEVQAGTVDLAGGLTNVSGTTLTGGTHDVTGTLKIPGADIRTNAAAIVLDGPASSIVDAGNADALTQFAVNTGEFTITNDRDLTVPGGFTNSGPLTVGPLSTFTVGGGCTQTSTGTTSGSGEVVVTTLVNSGTLRPGSALGMMSVSGNYEQTATGELEIELGGYVPGTDYDVLAVTGAAHLAGRLRVELVPPFDPAVADSFAFLEADTVLGTFGSVESFSMESHADYEGARVEAVVDAKHSRFTGAGGASWFNPANWTNGLPTGSQDVLVSSAVVVNGGTATAREVRVIGGGGSLTLQNGGVDCDTMRVRSGGIYSLTQETSLSRTASLVLEEGAIFGWGHGRVVVEGGRLAKGDPDFCVGDSPDTSWLELRDGAVMQVPGTVRVGRDYGDRGCITVRGPGTALHAGRIDVGVVGHGLVEVLEGGVVCAGWGEPMAPRTTVGAYGTLRGTGTLIGEVLNLGVVSPGPAAADPRTTAGIGTLHIAGSYHQEPAGTLELECAGSTTGGWDSLHVTSQAQLEGTLEIVRSFVLEALPDSAQVMTFGSHGGALDIRVRKASPTDAITVLPRYTTSGLTVVLQGTLGQVAVPEAQIPRPFAVYPNFPNPFRAATTIQFDLPERREVTLRIFDVQGRLVRTLLDGEPREAGTHRTNWLGDDDRGQRSAAGIYFYRLEAGRDGAHRQVRRMVKIG